MARFQIFKKVQFMSTSTAVNYTADQVSKMVETYSAADSQESRKEAVASIAKSLGKTVKSVIAKLSREGVYVKAQAVTKTGSKVIRKETIVKAIATSLDLEFSQIKSLGKATKADLEVLALALSKFLS